MSILARFLRRRVKNTLELKKNYKVVFDLKKTEVKNVMADLREFCSPDLLEGCGTPVDPVVLGVRIGREQVIKRIFEMLHIDQQDINNAIISTQYKEQDY